jgi:hypothetical protein
MTCADGASGPSAEAIRPRLAEIHAELAALPSDAFAEKQELNTEADQLKQEQRDLMQDRLDDASDEWSNRAARKGSHTQDERLDKAKTLIISPGEGGGT